MGKLIVIEGNDSSGKSTQVKLITKHLESRNLKVKNFHFPMYGDNEFSKVISNFLKGDYGDSKEVNPYFVANIYAMDQFLFLPKLKQALEVFDVVLLDRYVLSNIAYQISKIENKIDKTKFSQWLSDFYNLLVLPKPDLSLYLSLPIEIIKSRLKENRIGKDRKYLNGKEDVHEKDIKLQEDVHGNYIKIFNRKSNEQRVIVNCADLSGDFGNVHYFVLSPDEVFNRYKSYINNLL